MKTFGERLRAMRKSRGMTQRDLAIRSGINVTSIGHYERDSAVPTITSLEWLVKALETTATELLGF
jgi:transcriptional regulator with XRE-family HTH domain